MEGLQTSPVQPDSSRQQQNQQTTAGCSGYKYVLLAPEACEQLSAYHHSCTRPVTTNVQLLPANRREIGQYRLAAAQKPAEQLQHAVAGLQPHVEGPSAGPEAASPPETCGATQQPSSRSSDQLRKKNTCFLAKSNETPHRA